MPPHLPDFDVLMAMHQHDPEALERFRRHVLRAAVDNAPEEHRPSLERLLVEIETARTSAATPMEAAVNAFRLMQASVVRLHDGWEKALDAVAGLQTTLVIERARATSRLRAA